MLVEIGGFLVAIVFNDKRWVASFVEIWNLVELEWGEASGGWLDEALGGYVKMENVWLVWSPCRGEKGLV